MSSRCSLQLPEQELVEIFISNLNDEMKFYLDVKDIDSFNDMITKGLKYEWSLIKKGLIKIYNEPKDGPHPCFNSDKPSFWNKNKNIVNDRVVDARTIKSAQPVVRFAGQNPPPQTNIVAPPNQGRITSQDEPRPRQQKPKCTYTPLGEPIEIVLHQLVSQKLVTLPKTSNYEPQVKPSWWRDTEHCDFHQGKGHKTSNCHRLKDLIQDLIDRGEIEIEGHDPKTTNNDHLMFKNPLQGDT